VSPLIDVRDLKKTYLLGDIVVNALQGVTLAIERGTFVAIMGESGSGKSTLLNLLGCLDRPTSGRYLLDSIPVETMDFLPSPMVERNFRGSKSGVFLGSAVGAINSLSCVELHSSISSPNLASKDGLFCSELGKCRLTCLVIFCLVKCAKLCNIEHFSGGGVLHHIRVKSKEFTPEQTLSVPCTTCGAAIGEACELHTGDPRTEPHRDRKLSAAEAVEAQSGKRYQPARPCSVT